MSARKCTTHHHACDCREAIFLELQDTLDAIALFSKRWRKDVDMFQERVEAFSTKAQNIERKGFIRGGRNVLDFIDARIKALGDNVGKGDTYRPVDRKKYDEGYERIFGKKTWLPHTCVADPNSTALKCCICGRTMSHGNQDEATAS